MRVLRQYGLLLISLLFCPAIRLPAHAASEYVGSQFANGSVFSMVMVQDHLFAIPFPNVHSPLATGHIESWLVRWNVAALKTNLLNPPEKVIYLARQKRTGEILDGFRASASTSFIVCNPAAAVELWTVDQNKPAQLAKSLPADAPATTPPPARLFSRSERFLFIWKPAPAIYAVSNLSLVKQIKPTENFKRFEAALRNEGGWQETLTDDLRYLIHVPLHFGGQFNQTTMVDTPHCYDLENDEYSTWQMHAGTNQIVIVAAESINGKPQFIAFWEAAGAKHLGILDQNSQPLAELPTQGTTDTQFWRNTNWDYENSRFFVREPGGKLTICDYRANQIQHFSLAPVPLRAP